jgi:hypothetical protein
MSKHSNRKARRSKPAPLPARTSRARSDRSGGRPPRGALASPLEIQRAAPDPGDLRRARAALLVPGSAVAWLIARCLQLPLVAAFGMVAVAVAARLGLLLLAKSGAN